MLLLVREVSIAGSAIAAGLAGGLVPVRALWVGICAWAFSVAWRWDLTIPKD